MDENEIMNQNVNIIEEENNIEIIETVDFIDVEDTEALTVDSFSAFPAVGESNEYLKHQLLNGRELYDQHPITAITGLRDALDNIESLKTVYSDKRRHANYYLWKDENLLQEDRLGLFVSLCDSSNQIKICTDNDVFGVVVEDAGFIGGQYYVARDNKYGLVVDSGVVAVRCELDVDVGDSVISNAYGVAKKSDNEYGYKVVAIEDINGIVCAIIVLDVSVDDIYSLGNDNILLSGRMDDAEKNIVAAMNVANEAYNKANGLGGMVDGAIGAANNAAQQAGVAIDATNNIQTQIGLINQTAIQAQAAAESAAVSAEAIRNEAVKVANQALTDVSNAIDDIDVVIEEVQNSINDADSKAQSTIEDLNRLKDDMKPLAEWKDDEGNHSFAGFVAQADESSATIADLVKWQGDVEGGSVESIAGLERRVSDAEAELNAVVGYKKENEDGTTTDGFAGLIAQVNENGSGLSSLASYKYIDENGEVRTSGLVGLIEQVSANASSIQMLAGFEDEEVDSLGEIAIKVNANESAIDSLTSWQTDASKTIASTEQIAKENQASIIDLTNADTGLKNSMTQIEQKSDENGASITSLVVSIDKYSVGEYSQSYGLTHAQASDILKNGIVYVPTKHSNTKRTHSETFSDTNKTKEFTPGAYYIWNNNDWIEYKDSVAFFSEEPTPSRVLKYWYIDSNTAPPGYEPYALYMWETPDGEDPYWKKLNILAGNSSNRAVSMIRQTTNEIAAEVTNVKGDYSGLKLRVDKNEATAALVAKVVDPQTGKIKSASIINAVTDGKSSTAITADHIVLNGYNITNGDGSFQIDDDGYMIATGGNVGGWTIGSNKIYAGDSSTGVCVMQKPTENTTYVFAAGGTDHSSYKDCPFRVTKGGKLYAEKGEIAGWEINSNRMTTGLNGTGSFYMASAGASGYDNWLVAKNSAGDVTFKLSRNGVLTVAGADINGKIDFTSGYMDDDGLVLKTRGITLYNNVGLFGRTKDGSLRSVLVAMTDNDNFQIGASSQPGSTVLYANKDKNISLRIGSTEKAKINSSGMTVNGTSVTSDQRKKNSIVILGNKYNQLLNTLSAKTYKFNEHRTDVTNCGFIAQEVLVALSDVGLTPEEFGGFVDVYGDGTEYALDYTQFIPIMWEEIKTLRARVSELENKEN